MEKRRISSSLGETTYESFFILRVLQLWTHVYRPRVSDYGLLCYIRDLNCYNSCQNIKIIVITVAIDTTIVSIVSPTLTIKNDLAL